MSSEAVRSESHCKPVPKPRSKAPDSHAQSDRIPSSKPLDIPQRDTASSESQSSPSHEDLQKVAETSPDEATGIAAANTDCASQGDMDALPRTGKSFRKSLRDSHLIQEEEEDTGGSGLGDTAGSPENERSVVTAAGNMTSMGSDTSEEEEEKARFFAQIEAGASLTIDYSKSNRELESSHSTFTTELRKENHAAVEQSRAAAAESPACAASPHYSEDFEDEDCTKERSAENSKMSPILAKVSLYDSSDESGGEKRGKETAGSSDKGQSYAQSGGSEVEASQEAYRQIHSVENSEDPPRFSSEDGGRADPSVPPPPPQQSLQPVSTNESDSPTAEELMRPIRPENDQLRLFTSQPVSLDPGDSTSRDPELHQEQKSQSSKRTFLLQTPSESDAKQPGKTGSATASKVQRPTFHSSRCPEPPGHERHVSIRKEAQRSMQEEEKWSPQTSPSAGNAQKQPTSRGSSVCRSSMFSQRKPASAQWRGKPGDGKAAGGSKSPKTSRAAAAPRGLASKTKGTKKPEQDATAESGVRVSSESVASVQSSVAVSQQQVDISSPHHAMQEVMGPQDGRFSQPPPQIVEDSSGMEALRVQSAQKEKESQMMKAEAEEINSSRQQNYVSQSKSRSAEEANQKRRRSEAADSSSEEKLQQIDKEIKEQEMLIRGYQQENEKSYLQMKAQQAMRKANEAAMFKENQQSSNESASTREHSRKSSRPVGSVCSMDHTKRISESLAQVSALQRSETQSCEENHRSQQEKRSSEAELQLMKKEQESAKAHTTSTSGEKSSESMEEVAASRKKSQWFVENQESSDRDAGRSKAATAEILQLKEQVENSKQEVSKRSREPQRKAKDRSADTKRMQDLQRQVKESEQISRSRNPNSSPASIYAAASAAGEEKAACTGMAPPSRITASSERRIQRSESESEAHDEEAKRTSRAMEQQFQRIKLRYEQQICESEQQSEQKQPSDAAAAAALAGGSESWMSKCQRSEDESRRVQDSCQETEHRLQDQIESSQQQLTNRAQPSPGRHQRQAEAAFGARIERSNQELATKTRSIQESSRTVERSQRERSGTSSSSRQPLTESKPRAGRSRAQGSAAAAERHPEEGGFPAAQYEKNYQPTVFTGSHISEVSQENEASRQRVEVLTSQKEQQEEELRNSAAQAKEESYRSKEDFAEQSSSVKAEHSRASDSLRATHASEHSSSKVAESSHKLNSQESEMKHSQSQSKDSQECKEALSVSRRREEASQKQLSRSSQESKEAKEAQSSEVKLLFNSERKIVNMELRHEHREKESQQVVAETFQMSAVDSQSEVEQWRRSAQEKGRESNAFRSESDSISDILRHLQRHGVVLPTPEPGITAQLLQSS